MLSVLPDGLSCLVLTMEMHGGEGGRWVVLVLLADTCEVQVTSGADERTLEVAAQIAGSTLSLLVRLAALPGLTPTFEWGAIGMCKVGGGLDPSAGLWYSDAAPTAEFTMRSGAIFPGQPGVTATTASTSSPDGVDPAVRYAFEVKKIGQVVMPSVSTLNKWIGGKGGSESELDSAVRDLHEQLEIARSLTPPPEWTQI